MTMRAFWIIKIFIAMFPISVAQRKSHCEEPWTFNPSTSSCLYLNQTRYNNFLESALSCLKIQSRLASITSEEEEQFFFDFVYNHVKEVDYYNETKSWLWIGVTDVREEGSWQWFLYDEPWFNVQWSPRQPDNMKNEDCLNVWLSPPRVKKMNDGPCDLKTFPSIGFICKKNVNDIICEDGWYYDARTDFCYLVLEDLKTWFQAQAVCTRSYGATLTSIINYKEQEFIGVILSAKRQKTQMYWVGAKTAPTDDTWRWSDKSPWMMKIAKNGGGAFASRTCTDGYDNSVKWGEIVLGTDCEQFPELVESPSTTKLKKLSQVALNDSRFNQVLNETIQLTDPDLNLTEADIVCTTEILQNFGRFQAIQPTNLEDIYEIANNVLETSPGIIHAAQRVTNTANRFIESIDKITSKADLQGMKSLRIIKDFLSANILDQDGKETPIIGLKLQNEDDKGEHDLLDNIDVFDYQTPNDTNLGIIDTSIYLDPELFKGRATRVVYQIYKKTSLFESVSSSFELISKVAAAKLVVDNTSITDLGNNIILVIFRTTKNDNKTMCAFWDYRANEGAGGWTTDRCNKTVIDDKRVMCECNHLSNFAVLIDLKAYTISDEDKLILGIVTKIGLIVAIIGLGMTILTFIFFKHLRNGRGQQVLINLAVSMVCSSLIFLFGLDKTESLVGCKVVAALLHYFILVSFMWMLVEGILQYLRFVKVLGTYIPNFMLKTMIPAWGIPIIPVGIVVAIDHDLYYGGNGYCWLAHDGMLYWFIIPVASIMMSNTIVFGLVMGNLLCRRSMHSNQSERKMAFLHFQAAVSIFVILGLTWVFGFLAIDGARIIFHYIFAILNAFQGFFIFLLFTVREKLIRKAWKKMCCKEKADKVVSSSTGEGLLRRVT